MTWPILAILAAAVAVALHFWWKSRLATVTTTARHELSALKAAQEEAALENNARQETVFNSMVEGLLLLDQRGRIELANSAFNKLFALSKDVRSKTIIEALRLHEVADLVQSLEPANAVLERELRLSSPSERFLQVSAAAVFNTNGERHGTILVFHDLTRIKRLEAARQEFVANVSHELRTPLSLIKGYVETLLDGAKDNPEVATKFLQTIDRNADRLKLLIEDLLTISELESGRVLLNKKPVSLKAITKKVLEDFRSRAESKKMTLTDETVEFQVQADSDRLEQVLYNLIDNAVKYGRPTGTVKVSVKSLDDQFIEVSVEDDGPGVPPEAVERIFERFYRVDKGRSREQGGTGLGLSIVKHIVQSHGGRVWAKSELGRGASFHFTLPRSALRDASQQGPR